MISTLRSSPFSLPWGTDVTAKIVAYNSYGNSAESLPGAGAIISTYPSPPVNLREDLSRRGATRIGLKWDSGDTGGSPITGYTIYMKQGVGEWQMILSGIAIDEQVIAGLTTGLTY